ncbi:hypothetical protein GCM10011452_23900 [Gemmobacter lanyuensis]|uniref:CBS domain-containing protein n=1 Tax=Gemmobacter lanyuensis TaxID=1054497 RepID=A0A918IX43_9RHOB|nr:HPP family protein [Gemmobacter lanyuensis]GGW34704.1 hypothetical protein GCM10011452_23900 [Gemmobacter lanyuensis]
MNHFLRSLGPAVARPPLAEAVRAGVGALVALTLVGLLVLGPTVDLALGLYLIAPFGASSVLLFAVPNSPLAQPWSVIVGNTVAALVGVAVCLVVPDPTARIALAVGGSILVMLLCRAAHPPAGAVAMTAAMNPEAVQHLGFWFALAPVALGSAALVALAIPYARLTGRHYPFRQFDDPNSHGTADPEPAERLGLTEAELSDLLDRYRQSFNLGVEDLARLIAAAELQAAGHRTGALTAGEIMSRNLVTVPPEAPLLTVADLFRQHRFTSLPVVTDGGRYLGVIFQIHLITRVRAAAFQTHSGFAGAFRALLRAGPNPPVTAEGIMDTNLPCAQADTPIAALLPMMADGNVDAVPVLADARIVGIVTRSDLIAALARISLRAA